MKILFTLHDYSKPDAGGMGVTSGLADIYRELGHEVAYLSFDDLPGSLALSAKALLFPLLVAERLRGAAVDVVDSAVGDASLYGFSKRRKPLLVTRSHGLTQGADKARRREAARGGLQLSWRYPLYWGGLRIWEDAASLRAADLCLLLNEAERDYALSQLGIDRDRVRVVDNGLPAPMIGRPLEALELSGPFRVAHVGSFLSHKGLRYAIPALDEMLSGNPRASATFLGCGCPEAEVLERFAPANRARVEVVQRYARDDLPWLLSGHAAILSASLTEGFPLGPLEAMACGLIPVCSDIPGPTRYVRDGENGLLVPEADADATAQALQRLIDDPVLAGKLRTAAWETAQGYGWPRIGRETLAFYEEALARRGGRVAGREAVGA
jgi:glycosyltransferase involved in cell wall biosynthesis